MDRISKAKRSRLMSRIRGKDTVPERIVWQMLRELKDPPQRWAAMTGRPDFVFKDLGVAVFVDGCFFHRCPRHSSNPKTNKKFWQEKFKNNKARDEKVNQILRSEGWEVLRFWECKVKKDPDAVLCRIELMLEDKMEEMRDARADE